LSSLVVVAAVEVELVVVLVDYVPQLLQQAGEGP
jgi:hypothetical protein